MREAYIGVDVGTLSARAGVFNSAGRLIASARRPIVVWREPGDIVEQSSDDIWSAVTSAVREAVEASGLPAEAVRGMGFDATCSLVALDRNARPLVGEPDRCAGTGRDRVDGSSRRGRCRADQHAAA